MVGQRNVETVLQLAELAAGQFDDAIAGGHHFQRDLAEQFAETAHQLIALQSKHLLNAALIQFIAGAFLERQPPAHDNLFALLLIQHYHNIIV